MRFSLSAQLAWRAWREAESQQWIGVCDALRLTALGNTWGELHQHADDIVDALFTDLLRTGDLDEYLKQGWG